ncbi:putative HMG1 protein [Mycena maculata]|uniref:HMG1 protein n=1 Tax=Mycena maculata TaxID=230809 RepID=A0AAD7NAN1_9AGAR|nr:putative HMG1 protein [Mycena maculata]
MPATIVRRHLSDAMDSHSDSLKDSMSFLNFKPRLDEQQFEEPMLFDFEEYPSMTEEYPPYITPGYDSSGEMIDDMEPVFPLPPSSPVYELASPAYSPDSFYGSGSDGLYQEDFKSPLRIENMYLSNWLNRETDTSPIPSPSSPIPIPSGPQSPSFVAFSDHSGFAQDAPFSPAAFAAALPLPSSPSSSSFEDHHYAVPRAHIESVSPHETQTPAWATQLWETTGSRHLRTPSSPRSSARHSPLSDQRLRIPAPRRNSLSSGQLFPSSSAPTAVPVGQNTIRSYSTRRAESFSTPDDRDATVRRKKRPEESEVVQDKAHDSPPQKSMLRPPKLAPSAWQLYFTDWIQRQQASSSRKLNVAQAAKEAGQEYASLSEEEKEPYKRRSQAAKDVRERELNAYMRTLTPDDIKRENAFRSAQRKAGKSRKSNIKDPNAPKKPLSAYFMFLQRIRANPELVREIFGDETETTKQSVLAAAKWRSMTDDERKPFLAQAEQEKMEYEAARRLYEDGSVGYGSSINFSILPGSPAFPAIKIESESESEGFATDDGLYHIRS